jgi:DNA (cytosine-5)-methyltransferase 1
VIYGSVCSGIEAASVAWEPLGWSPAFFSEMDPFPNHVLHQRQGSGHPWFLPDENAASDIKERKERARLRKGNAPLPKETRTPNYGDMTEYERWPDHGPGSARPIDLLVGGTPCQSFSVAGERGGLDDPRGNLMLTYACVARRYRPRWLVWENVPGVLSSDRGRDFASLLGLLSGKRITVPKQGWKSAGFVTHGAHGYGLAWRVLDAQFVRVDGFERAVPQRRRRVFLVGYSGDWRRAAAVLFERESLSGNPAPRREAGKAVAGTLNARTHGGGGLGTDLGLDGGLGASSEVSPALRAKANHSLRCDSQAVVACANSGDVAYCLAAPAQQSLDAETETLIAFDTTQITSPHNRSNPQSGQACHALSAGSHPPAIAFDSKGTEVQFEEDGSHPPLRSMGHNASYSNAGGHAAIAYAIQERAVSENPDTGPDGLGVKTDGSAYTLEARTTAQIVAHQWAVRRLMPIECERLQGFPDGYTEIAWRGKVPEFCPDGPRYKALGNSMAVNVKRWLARRIEMVERMRELAA